jgi:hypothetical protein
MEKGSSFMSPLFEAKNELLTLSEADEASRLGFHCCVIYIMNLLVEFALLLPYYE